MATLVAQDMSRAGLKVVYSAAASGGDNFVNDGRQFIHCKNNHSVAISVTLSTPITVDGLAVNARTFTVPPGAETYAGPWPVNYYNNSEKKASITYSVATAFSLAIITPIS